MPGQPHRVELESIHWPTLLPGLHLFRAFQQAIHPAKMLPAFLLVLLLYLGGLGLDLVMGDQVYLREVATYINKSSAEFTRFVEMQDDIRDELLRQNVQPDERFGVFETFLDGELRAFQLLIASVLRLDPGVTAAFADVSGAGSGVIGALRLMFFTLPAWMLTAHPLFFWIYLVYGFALTALFGGAISRLAALHACRDTRAGTVSGLIFAGQRYLWFILAPLIPLLLAGAVALLLALLGLVLFNAPVLDIVGGALYGPLLLLGLLVALVLIGFVVAVHVLYPAIAIENADAFDAISRAYNYVLGRPARFILYVLVSLVFFAITYVLVSLVIYGAIWCTNAAAGAWAFAEAAEGLTRFDAVVTAAGGDETAGGTVGVAGWLVRMWRTLLLMLLPAFAVSFYFCSATWMYLLLRLAGDGVEFDDVYVESPPDVAPTAVPDATEPADA